MAIWQLHRFLSSEATWYSVADSVRSEQRCLWYTFCCKSPHIANQIYTNLMNLEARVEVWYILKFLSVTTQWQHVCNEHFKFHKVVERHYLGEIKNVHVICSRFIWETVCQISSKSHEFYRRYYKIHFGLYFSAGPTVLLRTRNYGPTTRTN